MFLIFVEVPAEWKNKQDRKCEGYETDENGERIYLDHWRQLFNDAKLEELENMAMKNNRNLFIAYERVQEARDLRGIAAADFYPHITLNPLTTNTVELIKNYVNRSAINTNTSSSSYANVRQAVNNTNALGKPFRVNLSYEVDL